MLQTTRRASVALAFLFACGAAVYAADEPKKDEPPPKLLVRERTVYVPYEKLKETFEKEGRGVFLPYEEFLKLWSAAQPKEKPPEEVKPPASAAITGGSYVGKASEKAARFEVTYAVRALEKSWAEVPLPLKNVAVETVQCSDPAAVFAPKGEGYVLIVPKPGEYTLNLAFSVRVDSTPGRRTFSFGIPPTAVSRLEMTIPEKDLRVEVTPKMAATVATPEGEGTKVLAFVGNAGEVTVTWMPPEDRVEKGEALVIASQAVHAELGERILRLNAACVYKIERHETDNFRVRLPAEMRLLSVKGNNIREWTTEEGVLVVRLHSLVKDNYALALRFERILEKTPEALDVPFPVTLNTLREDGYVTLAHEPALRVRVESSSGLSQVDPRELPEGLRLPNLLAGFRYLAHPLAVKLRIEQVQPQIQSSTTTVTSLGLDEDVLTGWVDYQVSKVGIFIARLRFPNRWEVATVGDKQTVEDFQVATEGEYKVLTVNLKNQALGAFRLPFRFTGAGRGAPGEVVVEPVQVLGTQQDKGLFGISAPKAFKLTTVERTKASSANVQMLVATGLLAQLPQDFDLPLAYTYTQYPASVKGSLERRKTEIRVTGYHVATVGDSGLKVSHELRYFIEFAAVDRLTFSLPKELDDKFHIQQFAAMKEKKRLGEKEGRSLWEVTLQDKMLGPLNILIEHEDNLKGLEPEKPQEVAISNVSAEEVKSQQGYVVVRKEGSLEIKPDAANLEPVEGASLPAELHVSNLYLAFRYYQADRALKLTLTRHVSVSLARSRADLLRVTAVVSQEKRLVVRALLFIESTGGPPLEIGLPEGAQIRGLSVNGRVIGAIDYKDGAALVKTPSDAPPGPFPVDLVYTQPLGAEGEKLGTLGRLELRTLELRGGVPVNKIEYDLYVPEEHAYWGFAGTLHPRPEGASNTLAWILGLGRAGRVDLGDTAEKFVSPPREFPTQGRLFRFQTLAAAGDVRFSYCGRKLFWLVNILALAAIVALGAFLDRRRHASRLWIALGGTLVPLLLAWFAVGDGAEPFVAATCGGVLLSGVFLLARLRAAYGGWREARLATAPDPFLEEAPEHPAGPAAPAKPEAPKDDSEPGKPDDVEDAKPDEPKGGGPKKRG